jgi:hypothetical protein
MLIKIIAFASTECYMQFISKKLHQIVKVRKYNY